VQNGVHFAYQFYADDTFTGFSMGKAIHGSWHVAGDEFSGRTPPGEEPSRNVSWSNGVLTMKWITHERVKVDRVACPWLIRKFVDPQAEFLFVPVDEVMTVAGREGAIPYDVKDVELRHHGKECSFDAILKKYRLDADAAMKLLAKIVNGTDTDNSLWQQPEAADALKRGDRLWCVQFEDRTTAVQYRSA
jgi:hypothetical protein